MRRLGFEPRVPEGSQFTAGCRFLSCARPLMSAEGFEPSPLAGPVPQTGVSTNSTTRTNLARAVKDRNDEVPPRGSGEGLRALARDLVCYARRPTQLRKSQDKER